MAVDHKNDFKRLVEWIERCPIDAAMLLEDMETRLNELTGVVVENARLRQELENE